jgi:hypothetical protein
MADRKNNRKASLFLLAPEGHFMTEAFDKDNGSIQKPDVSQTTKHQSRKDGQINIAHFQHLISESIRKEQLLRDKQSKNLCEFMEKYRHRKFQLKQSFGNKKASTKFNPQLQCLDQNAKTTEEHKTFQGRLEPTGNLPDSKTNTRSMLIRPLGNPKCHKKLYEEVSISKMSIPIEKENDIIWKQRVNDGTPVKRHSSVVSQLCDIQHRAASLGGLNSKRIIKVLHRSGILKDWNKFANIKEMDPRNSLFFRFF